MTNNITPVSALEDYIPLTASGPTIQDEWLHCCQYGPTKTFSFRSSDGLIMALAASSEKSALARRRQTTMKSESAAATSVPAVRPEGTVTE